MARQFWRASFWCPSWRPSAGGYRVSPAFTRHESPSDSRGGCVSRAAPHHRKPGPSSSARMSRTIGRSFGTRLFTSNSHHRSHEDDILFFGMPPPNTLERVFVVACISSRMNTERREDLVWPPLSAGTLLRVHPPDSFQPLSGEKETPSSRGGNARFDREGRIFTEVSFCFIPFCLLFHPSPFYLLIFSPSHSSPCISFIIPRFLCPAEIARSE